MKDEYKEWVDKMSNVDRHSNFKDRTGEKHITNEGYEIEIIEYFGKDFCTIRFEKGLIMYNISYKHITSGKIKNPYHKSVYGVGYIGEGDYLVTVGLKMTPANLAWRGMLSRCYDKDTQERQLTYKGCSVIKEWLNFQVFAAWFEENWKEHMLGWQLDKDILIKGNKIYSPETCNLVPKEVNCLFTKCNSVRGEYPIGVTKKLNRFQSHLSKNGKRIYLGSFLTPEEAFQAYKVAKENYIKEVADKYKGLISDKVYQALYNYEVEITD